MEELLNKGNSLREKGNLQTSKHTVLRPQSELSHSFKKGKNAAITVLAYLCSLLFFFPLLYMILTSFKPELQVIPPSLFFKPTLENYKTVLNSDIMLYLKNSVFVTLGVTIASLIVGIPAAYALVFGKLKNPDGIFFWFVTTNLLPPVGVILPLFLIFKYVHLLDTLLGLVIIYAGFNIPFVIWLVNSFFKEVPYELLEAAEIDGCPKLYGFFKIILPLTKTGILSAALLVVIFVWNEFFFAVNLTYAHSETLPVYMATFMTQEGLFWAKLSAISTICVLPPVILGWITQKSMIKGMTMGAVKG
jgi:ABC-type sugar transport system, permease component